MPHVDVGQDCKQLRLNLVVEELEGLIARCGEMQHIGPLTAAETSSSSRARTTASLRAFTTISPRTTQRALSTDIERSWAADECVARKVKSQQAVRTSHDADPFALTDFAGFVIIASQP